VTSPRGQIDALALHEQVRTVILSPDPQAQRVACASTVVVMQFAYTHPMGPAIATCYTHLNAPRTSIETSKTSTETADDPAWTCTMRPTIWAGWRANKISAEADPQIITPESDGQVDLCARIVNKVVTQHGAR